MIQALEVFAQVNAPLVETSGLLQQAKLEREQFYARIAAGNQVYQELVTSNVPKTNESLNELSVRVRNFFAASLYHIKRANHSKHDSLLL